MCCQALARHSNVNEHARFGHKQRRPRSRVLHAISIHQVNADVAKCWCTRKVRSSAMLTWRFADSGGAGHALRRGGGGAAPGAWGPHEGGSSIGRRSGGALAPRDAEGAAEGPQAAARRVAATACRPARQAHLRVRACTGCLSVSAWACVKRGMFPHAPGSSAAWNIAPLSRFVVLAGPYLDAIVGCVTQRYI